MIEQLQRALNLGDSQQAKYLIGQISDQQNLPQAQIPLVNLCLKQGFYDLGVQCFGKVANIESLALQVLPLIEEPSIRDNTAVTVSLLHSAHTAQPNNLAITLTLADHLLSSNQPSKAQNLLSKTLEKQPHSEVLARLAEAHYRQGSLFEAKACATVALEMSPSNPQSYINLAVIEKALLNLSESARLYSKTLELDGDNFFAHINLAQLCLMCGEFELGWSENEWRWQDSYCIKEQIPLPLWGGEMNPKLHLLLWADQGLGDQIMYLSLIQKLPCQVTVKVDPRLIPLLPSHINYLSATYSGDYSEFDTHISLGSLPRYLIHTVQDFVPSEQYLATELAAPSQQNKVLPRIGFSWRGGRYGTERDSRSLGFSIWETLVKIPHIEWVNLQYDTEQEEQQWLASKGIETPSIDLKNDLLATATIMKQLDGYLGIDNTTLHLAGSLGVKSLLMIPQLADWRWFNEEKHCYWYQSVQINRALPMEPDNTFEIEKLIDLLLLD